MLESINKVVNVIPATVTKIRINLIDFEFIFLLMSIKNTKTQTINVGIEYIALAIK